MAETPAAPLRSDAAARALLAAIAGVGFLAGLVGIREFDVFHHLAVGRQLLGDGFAAGEPFLFTQDGQPSGVPFYWLGSLALYAGHALGGIHGVVLLVGLAGATTFFLVGTQVLEEPPRDLGGIDRALALVPIALALGAWRVRAVARPEVLGLACFAWTLLALRRADRGRSRTISFFPLVAAIWSNVHISVVFGVAAVGLGAAGALWGPHGGQAPGDRRALGRRLAVLGLLAAAATFLNPGGGPLSVAASFGLRLLGFGPAPGPVGALDRGVEAAQSLVVEMQPPGWEILRTPIAALVVVGILSFVAARRRPQVAELALLLGLTLLGARAIRFVPWGAVAWASVAGANLLVARSRWPGARVQGRAVRGAVGSAAALLALGSVAWSFAFLPLPFGLSVEERLFPVRATEVLEGARAGARKARIFNWIGAGGWLEWQLPGARVYQDGRLRWPTGEERAARVGPSLRPVFATIDRRWRFDALVLRWPAAGDASTLAAGQDPASDRDAFALVALDDGGLLYARREGVLSELAEREYRFILPARPPAVSELADPAWLAGFRREADRARAERPTCDVCRALAWLGAVAAGDDAVASALLPDGRLPEPADPFGHGGLEAVAEAALELGRSRFEAGAVAAAAGDAARAEVEYRRSLSAFESAAGPHFNLGRLLLQTGDRAAAERHLARAVELQPSLRGDVVRTLSAPR